MVKYFYLVVKSNNDAADEDCESWRKKREKQRKKREMNFYRRFKVRIFLQICTAYTYIQLKEYFNGVRFLNFLYFERFS